jgi:hypothetical protein
MTLVELLRERKGEERAIVVHPCGSLEVRQKIVPLGVTLGKVSNARVKGHDRFEIERVSAADGAAELVIEPIEEFFARGQFEDLSDNQRLSVPAFERMTGGVRARGANLVKALGEVNELRVGFESILIGEDKTANRAQTAGGSNWAIARFAIKGSATARARQRLGHRARFAELRANPRVKCAEERYCIANAADLSRADLTDTLEDQANTGMSRMLADQMLADYVALNPDRANDFLVVSEHELQDAA